MNLTLREGITTFPWSKSSSTQAHDGPPHSSSNSSTNPSSKFSVQPPTFTPQQLYDLCTFRRSNLSTAGTVVVSAWYGKQATASYHEFIVIHVEDLTMPGRKNCMVIDRNPNNLGISNCALAAVWGNARDAFRISYDGDLTQLLAACQLTPHMVLEEIRIYPDELLPLVHLVTLVNHISELHSNYSLVDTNCYWFAGLIWECLRKMCPKAKYEVVVPGKRGRFSYTHFVMKPIQVRSVLRHVQKTLESENPESSLHSNASTLRFV